MPLTESTTYNCPNVSAGEEAEEFPQDQDATHFEFDNDNTYLQTIQTHTGRVLLRRSILEIGEVKSVFAETHTCVQPFAVEIGTSTLHLPAQTTQCSEHPDTLREKYTTDPKGLWRAYKLNPTVPASFSASRSTFADGTPTCVRVVTEASLAH